MHYEFCGELAQLGEHLPCTQGVAGSNPVFSTIVFGTAGSSLRIRK